MAADTIAPVTYLPGPRVAAGRVPIKPLNRQNLLTLLAAQMTRQDLLNPKSDLEMIPRRVSCTELEQSKSTKNDFAQLRAEQHPLQGLIGLTR